MTLRHENKGNGGGGSQPTEKITLISSRNTITCDETATGYDINVANEEALRYVIHNFKEFMEAAVDIGQNRYASKTSCVMQLVNDIDMTSPTQEDEDLYKVDGAKLIDIANKKYNFRKIFTYTTILCDGTRRTLQLTFPDSGRLDTWTFGAEWLRFTNVAVGGGITSYNKLHGTSYYVNSVNFSRYLLESTGNLNYGLSNCEITCCGAQDSSFNPFIKEGSGSNRPSIYHTRIDISGCSFWHGADPSGNIWSNCNAPIVIYSTYAENYERSIKVKQLIKSVSNSSSETGVPNIQVWTVDPSSQDYATIEQVWTTHPWQTTSDGTSLVSCQIEGALLLKTRMAVNDIYLQGTPFTQGNPPTEDWVSLVSLLQQQGGGVVITDDNDPLTDGDDLLGQRQNAQGNEEIKRFGLWNVASYIRKDIGLIDFYIYDPNNNDSRLILVAEVSSSNNSAKQLNGLVYYNITRDNVVDGCLQKIYVSWNHGSYSVRTDLLAQDGEIIPIKPCIVQYQNKYYIALQQFGKYSNIYFLGRQTLNLSAYVTPTALYYNSQTEKWYSDASRTSEVTVTFYAEPERFPANYLDFGGNASQVVAGDGSLLDWTSKLGYWEGTQQEYNDLPADQKDIPNVLYVID